MSMDKDREEFIDWLADVHGLESEWQEDRNCFKDFPAHLAFQAWQASRESLVIELPKPYAVVGDYAACGGGRSVWDVEYAEKITDRMCEKTAVYDRARLEAAGVKVAQ